MSETGSDRRRVVGVGAGFAGLSATRSMAGAPEEKPVLGGLRDMDDRMVILGGGLPIRIGGALIGGIGVGGAPGGHLDAACAQAGLEAIGAE